MEDEMEVMGKMCAECEKLCRQVLNCPNCRGEVKECDSCKDAFDFMGKCECEG